LRLHKLQPEDLSPRQAETVEWIEQRRGGVRGPYQAWIHSPDLADKVEALAYYARFESSLDTRLSELTLLIASRFWDAQYSWNAHVGQAIDAGVSAVALEDLAQHRQPHFENRDEQVLYAFCSEMLDSHFVRDETFAAASELFGDSGVVDIVGALGSFSMLGMCLNAFEIDLQPNREPPFPDVHGYEKAKSRP
jgi:4-carboxymuconolactone decarboxylase